MKKILGRYIVLFTALFSLAIASTTQARIVDRIVAIINDDCITLSELKERAKALLAQAGHPNQPLDDTVLAQLLPQVIDQYLIQKEVKKRGIKVTDQEIDLTIQDILQQNGVTMEELKEILKKQGKDLDQYRHEIKTQIEHSRLISQEVRGQIVVTDEEIDDYLKKHPVSSSQSGPIYVLQDIFVGFDGSKVSKEEAEKKIHAIYSGLNKPERDETALSQFQDLGSFTLDEMAPFLREHVKGLKKGDISGIISTENGFHIIRVKDLLLSNEDSLKAQRAEIRRKLMKEKLNARFEEWLKELRRNASIRILL